MPFENVRSDFDAYESWYESGRGARIEALEKREIEGLLRLLGAKTGLEVGWGTGRFTRWLTSLGVRSAGADVSTDALSFARGRDAGGSPYLTADGAHLPFRDSAFDACLFVTSMEFIADQEGALREAARVAKKGVAIIFLNRWNPLNIGRRIRGVLGHPRWSTARFLSAPRLRRAAQAWWGVFLGGGRRPLDFRPFRAAGIRKAKQ